MSTLQIATPMHRTAKPSYAKDVRRARTAPVRPAHHRSVPARTTAPTRPAAPAQPPLRLTRRGRFVVTLLMLGLVLTAAMFFGSHSAATGQSGTPVKTRTVVVERGDTLWAIASQVAHGRDVQDVVHDIEELNALPGPQLAEGQKIAVPVG